MLQLPLAVEVEVGTAALLLVELALVLVKLGPPGMAALPLLLNRDLGLAGWAAGMLRAQRGPLARQGLAPPLTPWARFPRSVAWPRLLPPPLGHRPPGAARLLPPVAVFA